MANHSKLLWLLALVFVAGCAALSLQQLEDQYGPSEPRTREVAAIDASAVDYWSDAKPLMEKRCVVCHACYDAPCQLKLSSIEGLERGATGAVVYQSARINMAPTTRLFEDAHSVAEWRDKKFHPVLNEFSDTLEANRKAGVMHRLLELKQTNRLPDEKLLPGDFTLSMSRKQFCARPETVDSYERQHPMWGMPYALPALDEDESQTLLDWLEQGATYTPRPPLSEAFNNEITVWEEFLNRDSLKAQLSARYIYEHLFLAHLYFPGIDRRTYFKLVRSATPPGQPLEVVATRRPYNDPGVDRVYYRLTEELGSIVVKTHMPYALDKDLLKNWKDWFVETDYQVSTWPSYADESASNPFLTFHQLPTQSRYEFLLERAQFTINSFIKGPVCRGQVALNVINDRFWVFFRDPQATKIDLVEEFSARHEVGLDLPAGSESIYTPISHWRHYARQQRERLAALDEYLAEAYTDPQDVSLELIWDGDGHNNNAALTVFRHFDSATVTKGLVGEPPKTAWVLSYSLLERIHYLLAAGYDVYGNVGHQLLTRTYMDFLRMEGETGFLLLLPPEARERERLHWYRRAEKDVDDYMRLPRFESAMHLDIGYSTDDEKLELYEMLKARLAPVLASHYELPLDRVGKSLRGLELLDAPAVQLLPQVVFVEIAAPSDSEHFTILRNNSHLNITSLLGENKFREPSEDTLTVVSGFLGAHPNVLLKVNRQDLHAFIETMAAMQDEADYSHLLDSYAIRRTSNGFWPHSDALHDAFKKVAPVEYGWFDFNRLENR